MSRTGTWSSAAGFTLVELALVVLLVGLFSAFAVPMFGNIGDGGLTPSARRLAGTVKYLYNEAALSGRPHRLVFDLKRGTFSALRHDRDGELVPVAGSFREQRLLGATRFRDLQVAGRGSFRSGEVTADFLPAGWVDELVIHLAGERGREMTLHVEPFTGATEVYEGYREF